MVDWQFYTLLAGVQFPHRLPGRVVSVNGKNQSHKLTKWFKSTPIHIPYPTLLDICTPHLYTKQVSTTDAGRVGEAKVLAKLAEGGWYPFVDISGKCPVDIVAWKDGRTISVQVKSTSTMASSGRWVVQIGCVRPNRSGNVIKKFDPTGQDYLAIYIAPLDVVTFLKSDAITAGRSLAISPIENNIA